MYLQIFVITAALGLLAWWASKRPSTPAPLPPGPAGDPIIGHVRVVPTSRPELSYAKWGKEYNSDVIYVNFMGQPVVVLNTAQVAIDLLDKRSNIYSNRPDFHFFEESGWEEAVTFLNLGPKFRKHRKMLQNAFSPVNCIPYRSKQEDLARVLVRSLLDNPLEWERLLVRFASSIVLGIAYGIRVTKDDDPFLKLANKIAWYFSNGGPPGATLVDILPIVRRLPSWVNFIPSLKFARDNRPTIQAFRTLPFNSVKKRMADGNPTISFTRKMLEEKQRADSESEFITSDITEDEIKGAASAIYAAGADTTFATLIIFVLNMVRNPAVQEKARRELDTVIGRSRLPTLDDRPNLPYLDRVFYETARWHPVVPLGVPHKSAKEDIYKNMYIPKGSLVMANAYAITHDASVYAEPDKFNPDRYLPVAEGGAGEPLPVGHFGFGRRVCPGQHLGGASVWIASATILATLKISKAKDATGNEITPDPKMTTGLESHPEHFPCVFGARDEQAVKLIRAATSAEAT